ncbi:succinate dehydrogenase, hydrophobic membrane anchor protein [Candidatus Pelagibacter sp.]|jgi:succinate dehydrogenase / fumarate reductase membrane anchor subunit|nr:succinate dehydrogenase, hydrophobic membrane anchor protein [Candidatus Pelagibacter sp.]|tara:strand:+ start:150 stop:473 length:324 start_codon:yes stop_codon:yes gene_type:complete
MLNATKKWLSLKLSSVIMVPFMIWFLVNFVSIYDSNYENIVEFFSSSQSALIFSIFIIITFFHSALSISEIFEDYIGSEKTRKFANMMVYLSSFIIPTITLLTLYKL